MVQRVSRQFSTAGTRPYGVEELLGHIFLLVLRFLSPLGIIRPISLLWVLGDKKLPVFALTAVHFKTPHAIENKKKGKKLFILTFR